MFDILDSNLDLGNLGVLSNTRSPSMKKISKKQNTPSSKPSQVIEKSPKMDFESILDGMVTKQSNFFKEIPNSTPQISNGTHHQLYDHHFEKSSQPRQITTITKTQAQRKRVSLKNEIQHNQSHMEMNGISQQFGRTQHTILNPSNIDESFVSSRHMKPPIKKKESMPYTQSYNFGSSVGNPIPEQDPTIFNSSQQNQELIPPMRSNRKTASIGSYSEMNQDIYPQTKTQNNFGGFHHDNVKQDSFMNINKSESCFLYQNNKITDHNFFTTKDKLQLKSQNLKTPEQQRKEKVLQKPQQKNTVDSKLIVEEYQKQITLIKNIYKSQIDYLQQSLDKQIAQNKTLRETFMLETTKLIEQQRNRSTRIHQEQVNRLKDVFSWEKKRIEDTYKMEIESLKSTFEFANKNYEHFKNKDGPKKQSLQFLEYQLKSKQAMVENKLKSIELRQMELQTKQNEISNRRKKEQDRYREEEKRLMDMQLELKKQILQNKMFMHHEKQQLANDFGTLQSQYRKKNEQFQSQRRELQILKNLLEEEKRELRRINREVMTKHKGDLQEIQIQKERLKQLQLDLVKKIRVLEMKAKQMTYQCNNHQDLSSIKKQANWVQQNQVFSRIPSHSAQKKLNNSKSMESFNKTKQRFYALQHNSKNKSKMSVKQNRKIDFSGYMKRIEAQNKLS